MYNVNKYYIFKFIFFKYKGGTSVYLTPIYNTAVNLSKEHEDFSKVMDEKINKKISEIKREHETKYKVSY